MSSSEARNRTVNLGAGPSMLPTGVLEEAAQGVLDYAGTGIGVTELSHRSKTFKDLLGKAEADLRKLLDIPQEYAVIFLQGGGTEQFSATLLNLLAAHAAKHPSYGNRAPPVDYIVSGSWSAKAYKEAQRLTPRVNVACDVRPSVGNAAVPVPAPADWNLSPLDELPALLFYCDNETIDGFEFPQDYILGLPAAYRERVPIVADCSSNVLSRRINVRAHSVLFFGAQKNIGPSGTAVVVVRRDLVVDPDAVQAAYVPPIPSTLVYRNAVANGSLYNTPPMFPIYVSGIVFRDLLRDGGVDAAQRRAHAKAQLVYDALVRHADVYRPTVAHPDFRSQMNITFRVCEGATKPPSEEREALFVKRCAEHNVVQVQGHRSVGGIRASFYNASTIEQAEAFVRVLDSFARG
ncbi:phosphoserine transaminase [Malassezia sp. CBS 17886]|nr:phosphoserine transaminase [Malassezia sp. CBS 17886]